MVSLFCTFTSNVFGVRILKVDVTQSLSLKLVTGQFGKLKTVFSLSDKVGMVSNQMF